MKTIKSIIIFALLAFIGACDVDYFDNPNAPQTPPTTAVFNDAVEEMVSDFNDVWFSGRFTMVIMQYWNQSEYGDEDRYVFRDAQKETWQEFYWNLENLRKVIQYNTDEDTKDAAAAYGANVNQIAITRIIMAWSFNILADTWGDIPYYSYGSPDDPDFQALKLADVDEEILSPVYAPQSKIYADILKELDEAAAMIDVNQAGLESGDNLYHGDMAQWILFANSLRLRVALKIRGVNAALANQHITDAQSGGVFTGNADNAAFQYEAKDANANRYYYNYHVDNRSDFAIGHSFTELLSGENLLDTNGVAFATNPFPGMVDPRIGIFIQPNDSGDYIGMPIVEGSSVSATIKWESLPGSAIIDVPDWAVTLMEFAEVEFILSELNGWDQTHYENGVRASMEKWGVPAADIDAYVAALPAASEATVLTQKFIALYMDPHTAWQEYRRSGYPQMIVKPHQNFLINVPKYNEQAKFVFVPLLDVDDLPARMQYPPFEQSLNQVNRKAAVDKLSNGDNIDSKLWWDVN
ncbi:MAG: hypothetical protein A2Y71_03835 [Bacteroidetes bacterium RBG_13_42_15]|nr:MAG: hypothetical protein A2Y71_03835 [Bacteroidetes bacterium RBG_13_42_15]